MTENNATMCSLILIVFFVKQRHQQVTDGIHNLPTRWNLYVWSTDTFAVHAVSQICRTVQLCDGRRQADVFSRTCYVVVIGDIARAFVVYARKTAMRAAHVTIVNILAEFIGLAVHCQNIRDRKSVV